jgi:hypothetical protein
VETPEAKIDLLTPGTEVEHISFSQVQMYLRCSMQYYFRYVLGRKERPRLHFARGTAGHEATELNARHKIATGEDQPLEQILDNFDTAWNRELTDMEKTDILPGEDPGKEKDNTVETLRLYRGTHAPLVTPEAVELEFKVEFAPTEEYHEPLKPVVGKIDIINRLKRAVHPGAKPVKRTELVDRKFPGRLPSNMQQRADIDLQLTTYDAVLAQAGKKTDDLGFQYFVPPTKTIGPRLFNIYRDPLLMLPEARRDRHGRMLYMYRTVTRAIKAGIFTFRDDPQVCNGCGFKEICQVGMKYRDYEGLQLRAKSGTNLPLSARNP